MRGAHQEARVATVLVVDDDLRTQRMLHEVFRTHGFAVAVASDGGQALGVLKAKRPDAIVLDLRMPKVSGLEALRTLRRAGEDLPVVVLTGVIEEDSILEAFAAGADDYVTKPFQPRVLVARVRAALRRSRDGRPAGSPGLALDQRTRHASVDGKQVALSPTEYQLLRTLMHEAGRVFSATELLMLVWGPAYVGQDDIVRANIYRLRRKLEPKPNEPRYILGRRGAGYYLAQFTDA